MDVFDAVKGRRSCRRFLSESIGEVKIRQIMEAAVWAPSPANNQPWEFVVITNSSTVLSSRRSWGSGHPGTLKGPLHPGE
jgi:nitroreductase